MYNWLKKLLCILMTLFIMTGCMTIKAEDDDQTENIQDEISQITEENDNHEDELESEETVVIEDELQEETDITADEFEYDAIDQEEEILNEEDSETGLSDIEEDTENIEEQPEEYNSEFPAFEQETQIDDVIIKVSADEGVFPEGAVLSVLKVEIFEIDNETVEAIEQAVSEARDEQKNVALSFTYDIKVLDQDGNEFEPEGPVSVKFSLVQKMQDVLNVDVYHTGEDMVSEQLDTQVSENTEEDDLNTDVEVVTDSFSYYTVEFTYNDLQYVLEGDSTVELAEILNYVGLNGDAENVEVSDPSLFEAYLEDEIWYVKANIAFETQEWMKVVIDGIEYEITVTDTTTGVQVKYAVAIYGIEHDIDENGNTMGLTFGPATGADYINSYHSHTPTGSTASGNPHRCVHNDDWETIILWNNTDPYVYEQCISESCTHSVSLALNSTLANTSFNQSGTGDGPSALFAEIESGRGQHLRWNPLTGNTGDSDANAYGSTVNGYGGSRIRAVLNGYDSLTQTTGGYASSIAAADRPTLDVTSYTSSNSLFSCFPSELQAAIGSRKTVYRINIYSSETATVYDKLFLFSIRELCDTAEAYGGGEGAEYQRMIGSGAYNSSSELRKAYVFETSYWGNGEKSYWTRSMSNIENNNYAWDAIRAARILQDGAYSQLAATRNPLWLAPGFALRKDSVNCALSAPTTISTNSTDQVNVQYTITNGYASVGISSLNGYKFMNSGDGISYSISDDTFEYLTGTGTLSIDVEIDPNALPKHSGNYTDVLTFEISIGGGSHS